MEAVSNIRAIVLAGGKGTRLNPLTMRWPKPLCWVGNKTIAELVIQQMWRAGIKQGVIVTGHSGQKFKKYFQANPLGLKDFQLSLHFSEPDFILPRGEVGSALLGARYFLSQADPGEPMTFAMSAGDILSNSCFRTLIEDHQHHNATATMTVTSMLPERLGPFGTVLREGDRPFFGATGAITETEAPERTARVLNIVEKMPLDQVVSNLINCSQFAFDRKFFDFIHQHSLVEGVMARQKKMQAQIRAGKSFPAEEIRCWQREPHLASHFLPWLLEKVALQNNRGRTINCPADFSLWGHLMEEDRFWTDVGTLEELLEANLRAARGRYNLGIEKIGHGVKIEKGAEVDDRTILGNNVTVKRGAKIINSVVPDDCEIGPNTVIDRSVIFPRPFHSLGLGYPENQPLRIGRNSEISRMIIAAPEVEPGSDLSQDKVGIVYIKDK